MKTHLLAGLLAAVFAAATAHGEVDLRGQVKELVLQNGMKWIVVERPQAPVFTGFIRVKAGGLDEESGYTGLAHLFEHMAFKGTPVLGTTNFEAEKTLLEKIARTGDQLALLERAGKGQTGEAAALKKTLEALSEEHGKLTDENALSALYQLRGAAGLNATTDKDLTSYFVSLPRNALEVWAQVEASRLASPVLRDFYKERDVVMEERRMRIDSEPDGAMFEELTQAAFTMSPYRWPVVGYMPDLAAMTLERATAFHKRFYVPANAIGCLVGDVKVEEVRALLERTFGAIPAGPRPATVTFSEPPRRNARRSTVTFDASPRLIMAFHKPTVPAREDYIFDVLQVLLGHGKTGRLHKRLVLKDRLAQSVAAFGEPGARLENLFAVYVIPMEGKTTADVERVVWEELDRLKTERIPANELEKVRNRVTADLARSVDTHSEMAGTLSYFEATAGDWRYVADHPKVVESITAEEIQRVAQEYFTPENSVVVDLKRPAVAKGGTP